MGEQLVVVLVCTYGRNADARRSRAQLLEPVDDFWGDWFNTYCTPVEFNFLPHDASEYTSSRSFYPGGFSISYILPDNASVIEGILLC